MTAVVEQLLSVCRSVIYNSINIPLAENNTNAGKETALVSVGSVLRVFTSTTMSAAGCSRKTSFGDGLPIERSCSAVSILSSPNGSRETAVVSVGSVRVFASTTMNNKQKVLPNYQQVCNKYPEPAPIPCLRHCMAKLDN